MPAEISFHNLAQARARLAAMPRQEVEAVCTKALMDAGALAAGIFDMGRLISEAQTFLKNSDIERADICLGQALEYSGDSPTSVPAGVLLQ